MAPKAFGCFKASDQSEGLRRVLINSGDPHKGYRSNAISTTKYNIFTFLPKALFEQYRRIANVYFTLVAGLSLTPYSPVRAWTTWAPLAFVLGVSMVKEGIEDYKRYKQDKEVNLRLVDVLDPASGQYVAKKWQEVRVGEVVIVRRDQQFPADLLFLSAQNEEGTCYIETMNLDGETNLKIKKAPDETKDLRVEQFGSYKDVVLECEGPNARLYQFVGNYLSDGVTVPISPAAILLRGCNLRNTDLVVGVVIYAGHETKIFMNATQTPSKRSSVERIIDKIILFMFSVLFSMCICGAVFFANWTANKSPKNWYLDPLKADARQYDPAQRSFVGLASFITSFILYGYLIPISLYVSVEMVKIFQSMILINRDRDMYHEETDTPARARTSNLNEELGMVNTIMSDKTGTLTCNVMEFFKCSIAGVAYGAGITEIERANAARKGIMLEVRENMEAPQFRERFFNFYDKRLMDGAWTNEADPATIEMFFRLLAVCHTVIPDGPPDEKEMKYEAESPDEAALVVAAKAFGFFFYKRTNTTCIVRERTAAGTSDVVYEVLNVLEFNSTRKRMSVVIRDRSTDRLLIFTKGADTVIYERLDPTYSPNAVMKESTSRHMEEFGSAGLRTLCLSYAEIDRDWYNNEWQPKWVEAKTSLQNREDKVSAVSEEIERNLRLLGCTAIEDKLQDQVPQSIKQLALAGIRIWVLTGDKMETAINIGFACSLLTEDMHQFIVSVYDVKEVEEAERRGDKAAAEAAAYAAVEDTIKTVERTMDDKGKGAVFAMIIDGKALSYALSENLSAAFLRVGLRCKAVVCCRVSPLQKAQVTALVRSYGHTTLAIGDGANDVGMIQKAHIGVGISGQEGMQAAMSADFSIAQFKFLVPLLLVHGRYSYKRIARMVLFFFYKNMMFGVTIFTFNAFNNFSGQYIYNDFYMTLYNVVFTALTPLAIGMFDRDVDKQWGLEYPGLYMQGQRNEYFNFRAIALWLISALYQCAIVFVFTLVGCRSTFSDRASGQTYSLLQNGIVMFSTIIITVHMQVIQINENWTWLHHLSIWLSIAVWWFYLLAYGAWPLYFSGDLQDLFLGIVASSAQYWFYLLLVPTACQLPDYFLRQMKRQLFPSDHEVVAEIDKAARRARGRGQVGISAPADEASQSQYNGLGQQPQAPSEIMQQIFGSKPNPNKGFVPPYDPRSKFYGLVSSGAQKTGRIDTAARSPVLTHLDEEITHNPYRGKKKQPQPSQMTRTKSPAHSSNGAVPTIGDSAGSPPAEYTNGAASGGSRTTTATEDGAAGIDPLGASARTKNGKLPPISGVGAFDAMTSDPASTSSPMAPNPAAYASLTPTNVRSRLPPIDSRTASVSNPNQISHPGPDSQQE